MLSVFGELLSNSNANLNAYTTATGRQVIKANTGLSSGITKRSAVRYSNGTIVETIVYKPNR